LGFFSKGRCLVDDRQARNRGDHRSTSIVMPSAWPGPSARSA